LPSHRDIGSHLLGDVFAEDVVGNAAALDVFKFLKIDVEGRRLLDWMADVDADLQVALSDDAEIAAAWMQSFASLVRQGQEATSHVMAKQLYWLVGQEPAEDVDYHLLQPLFSSSLAHAVHADIQEVRFGETNKAARQARRDKAGHEGPYHEYRNLAVRKLGGTKPQNISQLNSERGGVNYLLSSLPPHWHANNRIRVLKVDSVLESFLWFEDVREQVKALADFLLRNPDPILETREQREAMEQELGLQLALFGDSIRLSQEPGWTRSPDCRLPLCEQLWLDPERTLLPLRDTHESEDADFNAAYSWGDWPDEVAVRFANWLNAQLHKAGLVAVGASEYRHWAHQAILDVDWPVPVQQRAAGGGI
jgi:CRISPR-associated protein Csy1